MRFKPFTDRYNHSGSSLVEDYPDYLMAPIGSWIKSVLWSAEIWRRTDDFIYTAQAIDGNFLNNLDIHFRERFPKDVESFLPFVLQDADRTTDILNLCLQNYATTQQIYQLERILEIGGSAYSAVFTIADPQSYSKGVGEIVRRVPNIVAESSQEALDGEAMLREAWIACYSRNPDYEKVISRSCDVLEKTWNKYFPKDPKPQVKKFVHALRANPELLAYKGSSTVSPKTLVTDIAESFSDIRGQHTSGEGRIPTKEEAELVLHYTIFIWNLER